MFGRKKSAARAERILILHGRAEPGPGEIQQLVDAYVSDIAGADLEGARVTTYQDEGEPDSDLALAVVRGLEGQGQVGPDALARTTTKSFQTSKGPIVVAGVWRGNALPPVLRAK